jgi:hypothetical protein
MMSRIGFATVAQFRDDRPRRFRRREHAVPQRHREAFDAPLDAGRHVGQGGIALLGQREKDPDLARLRARLELELDLAVERRDWDDSYGPNLGT